MYLRFTRRRKDGKEHRYWSIVESKRCAGGRVVQRPVLYLGEINDGQHATWCRVIEGFDEGSGRHRQLALFSAERAVPDHARGFGVQVRLDAMELHHPRQWGACWLACHLYEQLQLDRFFAPLLPSSREGTSWQHILQTLVCYRLIDPGSEWRLHRQWFEQSAMELCWRLGDEVDQAAWWAGISMTSMPFWNLIPWTTFGNWFSPFNRRHVFAAALTSLNTMSLAVFADRDPFVRAVR